MKDKQPLKEQLDNLIPKLRQIDNHALSNVDAHTKELYMTLLAAIAFEDRKLEQREEHYLQTLCNSVKDVDYENIQRRIDKIGDTLEESLKAIEENKLAVWLFIDALIICRIDSEITEKESKLLGSLADSLKLTPKEVSLCLKMATVILSQDEAMLHEMMAETPRDFPLYSLQAAYTSPWVEAKLSLAKELAEGREPKGKYLILRPVRISGEKELRDIELVFAGNAHITITKDAKLKITDSQLNNARIVCDEKSTLTLNNCNLSGGQGIYCQIGSSLSVSQCRFDNVGIVSEKASKIYLDETIFENLTNKRAMSLTNCMNVTLKKSKFISCGYGIENAVKEEGGALLIKDSAILIDACHFENCTAAGDGGAISFWKSGYGIKDSKFIRCKSGINGGAIAVHDTLQVKNELKSLLGFVVFVGNGSGVPRSVDVDFLECTGANYGGAVMSYTRELRFANCLFERCSAPYRGGGVTVMDSDLKEPYTRFFACRFVENNAKDGNGLWMQRFRCGDKSSFMFEDPEIVNNDIRDSTFHKCTTNHEHGKNSDGKTSCSLSKQNTFT